jgi:hypothetical protein
MWIEISNTVLKQLRLITLFQDNISIRAITADANKIWYAANNSRFGFTIWKKNLKAKSQRIVYR